MKMRGRRTRDQWLPNYYPARMVADDAYFRVSRTGATTVLSSNEDAQLTELFMEQALFSRLERTGHIVTEKNATNVMKDLREWLRNTYSGPTLHIVVLTKRCNLNCTFCHMNPLPADRRNMDSDMSLDTAEAVVRFALQSPNKEITFEFQGGEPFLNFKAMQMVVSTAEREAGPTRVIRFIAVSNLLTINPEQLKYCRDHNISVSYSLNGPLEIHDKYRIDIRGKGSFARVMPKVQKLLTDFGDVVRPTPLCVIDAKIAPMIGKTIDFFYEAGFPGVALIRLKPLGNSRVNGLQFDIREFISAYISGLDHIFSLNKMSDRTFTERMIPIALAKLLGKRDVGFVDWRNPCGDVTGALTYDYDGMILPVDEARSLRPMFELGNVKSMTYKELISRKETFFTTNLSVRDRDPACRECAYNPFCGVMPVLDYARDGNPVPRPFESDECLFTQALLDWTIKKLYEEPIPLFRMVGSVDDWLLKLVEGDTN